MTKPSMSPCPVSFIYEVFDRSFLCFSEGTRRSLQIAQASVTWFLCLETVQAP